MSHIPMKILIDEMIKLNKLSNKPSKYYESVESIYKLYGQFASIDHFHDFLSDLILFRKELEQKI